jgi:RIO kinase 1
VNQMIDIDAFEEMDDLPSTVNIKKPVLRKNKPQVNLTNQSQEILGQIKEDREVDFPYSYTPSRFEGRWLIDSLGGFYEEHWFDDVLRMIKGGKEASVYLCRGNATTGKDLLAAKVYRPRMFRNLKDDHIYREGRAHLDEAGLEITDDRAERAIKKRTKFGLNLLHVDWIQHEFNTMKMLYQVGAALPKPYVCANNAILMDYIGDEDTAAPTLNTVNLSRRSAARLFGRVVENIRLMLHHNLIHGDFSAYNLLYWEDDIWMIDFPQAFPTRGNQHAWTIFHRDVERVCQYFIRQGVTMDVGDISRSLWKERGLKTNEELALELVTE